MTLYGMRGLSPDRLNKRIGGDGKMILDKEKQKEFEKAAEPLIKFLCDNFYPHVSVTVECGSAKLSEDVCSIRTDKFIKD